MGARGRKSAADLETSPVQLVSRAPPVALPDPPGHLSPGMAAWWRQVVEAYDLDPHHLRLLESACDAWDRMVQAREALRRDGLTVQGAQGPKTHPAANVERDSRMAFARLVRELDLDCEAPQERAGWRPPPLRSNRRR
jgi:P27 family predicted phage terminase small subunit